MKILHMMLSCFYIDNFNYQENTLPKQNYEDGHEVYIIASTETYVDNKELGYMHPGSYVTEYGVPITRVPYKKVLTQKISAKIRGYKGVYKLIEGFLPDIILFHGCCSYELLTVARYKKNHPDVKLYLDSHEDFNNSATNFLSKYVLHKIYYRFIIKQSLPYFDKVFCVSYECFDFLRQLYGVPNDIMEFYPLGGVLFDGAIRQEKRRKIRKTLMLKDDDILIIHSGKMDKHKRSEEILKAFVQVPSNRLRLVIIGSMNDEVKQNVELLISSDKRVNFLGWKNGDELMEYLCACDLYIQPGGQSATMQNALCCGSAAVLYPHQSHKVLLNDSVFYVETIDDIKRVFEDILEDREVLENKRVQTNKIAHEILDYKVLASRLYK